MSWHDGAIAIAFFGIGWAVFCYARGMFLAWREDQRRRDIFTFRAIGGDYERFVGLVAGMNPWGGVLVTDKPIGREQGEILRAAVERYRARTALLPIDGQRFELVEGELVKL